MRPQTLEWIDKAEGDFAIAESLIARRSAIVNDGICFHAQQCAEKYLKAVLYEAGKLPQRTHDLPQLLAEAINVFPWLHVLAPAAQRLVDYAVRFRYPGAWATRPLARTALNQTKLVREAVRTSLGLPVVKGRSPRKRAKTKTPRRQTSSTRRKRKKS